MGEKQARHKILFVDDVPANVRILVETLKDDYKVVFVQSGAEALNLITNESLPDLILLDIMMPEMDGYELCRRLKKDKKTRDVPIIFVTALDGEEDEALGLELGAVDYISKPFSLPIIKARLKTHLDLKLHRDQLERQKQELITANARLEEEIAERIKVEDMVREHLSLVQDLIKDNSLLSSSRISSTP